MSTFQQFPPFGWLSARLALDPMVDYGEMNGLDPSILRKPCRLACQNLLIGKILQQKKQWFTILLNNKKFLMYIYVITFCIHEIMTH